MNQQIGITYGSTGEEKVFSVFRQLDTHLDTLERKLGSVEKTFNRFFGFIGRTANEALGPVNNLGRAFGTIRGTAESANKQVGELNANLAGISRSRVPRDIFTPLTKGAKAAKSEISALNTSVEGLSRSRAAERPGLFSARLPGTGRMQPGREALPYLARWFGMYAGGRAGYRSFEDIALGGARKELMEPSKDLAAVGFDALQRKRTEIAGQKFLRNVWAAGNIKDYLGAVAEAGSAIDVNDPRFGGKGVDVLNKMGQSSAILGAVSQMRTEAASKLLMSTLHAQLFQMPDAQRVKYETGKADWGQFAETTAGKIGEIIKTSMIWGKDVQLGLSYALPSALSKGWSLDTILAMLGTGKTAGYPGQKFGRGLRAILEGETGKIGALSLAGGDEKVWAKYQAMTGSQKKAERGRMSVEIGRRMGTDPWGLFRDMGGWLDTAEKRGIDPQQGLGLSKEWIGQMRLMGKQGFISTAQKAEQQLRERKGLGPSMAALNDIQADSGWLGTRLSNSWTGLKQSLGRDTPLGGMVDSWAAGMDMLADYNNSGAKFNYRTALRETKDFLVHGLGEGLYQTVKGFQQAIAQELSHTFMPGKVPSLDALRMFPSEIHAKFEGFVSGINGTFSSIDKAVQGRLEAWKKAFSDVNQWMTPDPWAGKLTPKMDKGTIAPGVGNTLPKIETPKNPILQQIMPGRPASWDDDGSGLMVRPAIRGGDAGREPSPVSDSVLANAIMALVSFLSQDHRRGQQPIHVQIGDRAIRDVVVDTLVERDTVEGAKFSNRRI